MNTVANDDGWELYNTLEDFSLATNLAGQYPERLEAMRATFMEEAIANLAAADRWLSKIRGGSDDVAIARRDIGMIAESLGGIKNGY